MNNKRIQDAEKLVKKGESYLKTGLFKWSSDIDSAVESFEKAVIQFRNASEHKSALMILLRIANLNESRGNSFHAGKAFDSASASCRELNDMDGVLVYADLAADMFVKGNVPDTAFNTLTRAAKYVEKEKIDAAVQFYHKAAELYMSIEGGRIREAADVLARAGCLQIRAKQYDSAITTVARERDLRIEAKSYDGASRTNCCLVLIYLANINYADAKKIQKEGYALIDSYDKYDGSVLIDELLDANESGSAEDCASILKHPYFRNLDNDYVKLVCKMKKIDGIEQEIDLNDIHTNSNVPDLNKVESEEEPNLC